jgi:hypothetical protein
MGDGMPYHLEKGPYWSVAESVVNSDQNTRLSILNFLRGGAPMTDLGGAGFALTSTSLASPATPTPQSVKAHGDQDWLGGTYNAAGAFVPTPGAPTTGKFQNYSGNIEGILRQTFIRALEVSLGLAHKPPDQPLGAPTRFWPIEYFWKCPTAWVEGWVTWRREPSGDGHVTVHLLTPAHGHAVLTSPANGRNPQLDPTDCDIDNGMWLVTHKRHRRELAMTTDNSEFAVWKFPALGPVYFGEGPIVVVAPSEIDGGVAPDGRPFVAPAPVPGGP